MGGIITTTIILITCVVGIPLFMIKNNIKNGIPTTIILLKTPNMVSIIVAGIPFLMIYLIINSGIPTTHQYYSCCRYIFYYSVNVK